jgi:hypothetical protein
MSSKRKSHPTRIPDDVAVAPERPAMAQHEGSFLEKAQLECLRAMALASVAQQQQHTDVLAAYRELLLKQQQRRSMEGVLKLLASSRGMIHEEKEAR